jgi:putative FmdB family regulatory protein
MARYEFKCSECNFIVEVIQAMATATFGNRKCPRCNKMTAVHVVSAPAVATSGMTHAPIDVVVGRDAAARWADIGRRQELRNKARTAGGTEEGSGAVRMTGRNKFEAIPDAKRVLVNAPNDGRKDD